MILMVSPVAPSEMLGNAVTAQRWSAMLRALGHRVTVTDQYHPGPYAALVALHARKTAEAVRTFHAQHPDAPIVLALSGTDLYPDLTSAGVDPAVLRLASRLVVLQANGLAQLDVELREVTRVIVQSVPDIPPQPGRQDIVEVAVLAHLRPVKDPLRAAAAVRLLPESSRIQVTHLGAGLDVELAQAARAESDENARYAWLGEVDRGEALGLLARSKLLVLTSRHEGGANAVSEALAAGVPVLSSAIAGSTGILGEDYPGYFPVGDTAALAALLEDAETDRDGFYTDIAHRCARLRDLVEPRWEQAAWAALLDELDLTVPGWKETSCEELG